MTYGAPTKQLCDCPGTGAGSIRVQPSLGGWAWLSGLEVIAVIVGPGEQGPRFSDAAAALALDQPHTLAPHGSFRAAAGRREGLTRFTGLPGHHALYSITARSTSPVGGLIVPTEGERSFLNTCYEKKRMTGASC